MEKSKCLYAFRALTINKGGAISPCPSYNGSVGHLSEVSDLKDFFQNGATLKDLRDAENEGRWHRPGCGFCEERPENSAKENFRDFFSRCFPEYFATTPEMNHLDIDFSNFCNLECAMCSSEYSSKWYESDVAYNRQSETHGIVRPQVKPWRLSDDKVDQLIQLAGTVKSIHIKGGEPLLEKGFARFMEGLTRGRPEWHRLVIVTNFTLMDDKYQEIFSKFQDMVINVSVDGVGSTYSWVRGHEFAKLEDKLLTFIPKLQRCKFVFNFTASVYNIHLIEDFYSWVADVRRRTGATIDIQWGPVVKHPKFLVPALSPLKHRALEQIDRVLSDPLGIGYSDLFKSSLRSLRENLMTTQYLEVHRLKFAAWHKFLVTQRGWDILRRPEVGVSIELLQLLGSEPESV